VLIVASLVPIAAAVAIFTLVRNTSATKQGLVQAI
jgi:hypothetical protein